MNSRKSVNISRREVAKRASAFLAKNRRWLRLVSLGALVVHMPSAWAQTQPETDIETVIDASSSPDSALEMARVQSEAGDLSAAAATLERVLLVDRSANLVRLNYVALLCQLDDRQAAGFELAKLKGQSIDEGAWSKIESTCGSMTKP